jgi:uncharacterized short protein YbdD (DUF466 family)
VKELIRVVARALRVMVGAPRYDAYRAHVARHHPHVQPMTQAEFERVRLESRYEKPNRCC